MVSLIVYALCGLAIASGAALILYTIVSGLRSRRGHVQQELTVELDFSTREQAETTMPDLIEPPGEAVSAAQEDLALSTATVSGLASQSISDDQVRPAQKDEGRSEMTALDWLVNDHVELPEGSKRMDMKNDPKGA